MAVVVTGDIVQLFQIERDDLVVEGDQLLLLDVIVGFVRDDRDLYNGRRGGKDWFLQGLDGERRLGGRGTSSFFIDLNVFFLLFIRHISNVLIAVYWKF